MSGLPFYNRLSLLGAGGLILLLLGSAFGYYSKYQVLAPVNEARKQSQQQIELEKIKLEADIERARLESSKKAVISESKQVEANLDGYPVDMKSIEKIDACTNLRDQNGYQIGAAQRGVFYKNQFCS